MTACGALIINHITITIVLHFSLKHIMMSVILCIVRTGDSGPELSNTELQIKSLRSPLTIHLPSWDHIAYSACESRLKWVTIAFLDIDHMMPLTEVWITLTLLSICL